MSTKHTYNRFFITGLPRTGTTWLMNLVNQISGVHCYGEGKLYSSPAVNVQSLIQGIRAAVTPWARFIAHRKHNVLRTDDVIHTIERENIVPESAIENAIDVTTSAAMSGVVDALLCPDEGEKTPQTSGDELSALVASQGEALIVVMIRNVYDWLVSYARFYYLRRHERATEWRYVGFTDEDYLHLEAVFHGEERRFLPDATLARLSAMWGAYVRRAGIAAAENVMIVEYEELYKDTLGVLSSVLDLLVDYEPAEAELAVENMNVDHMRARNVMRTHINRPAPNENRELLTEEDIAVIDREIATEAYYAVDC